MLFSELKNEHKELLDLVRSLMLKGCAPNGYPAVAPCWRVASGVEDDDETDEVRAIRRAMARLQELDPDGHEAVTRAASGATARLDPHAVARALEQLDAAVDAALAGSA